MVLCVRCEKRADFNGAEHGKGKKRRRVGAGFRNSLQRGIVSLCELAQAAKRQKTERSGNKVEAEQRETADKGRIVVDAQAEHGIAYVKAA